MSVYIQGALTDGYDSDDGHQYWSNVQGHWTLKAFLFGDIFPRYEVPSMAVSLGVPDGMTLNEEPSTTGDAEDHNVLPFVTTMHGRNPRTVPLSSLLYYDYSRKFLDKTTGGYITMREFLDDGYFEWLDSLLINNDAYTHLVLWTD